MSVPHTHFLRLRPFIECVPYLETNALTMYQRNRLQYNSHTTDYSKPDAGLKTFAIGCDIFDLQPEVIECREMPRRATGPSTGLYAEPQRYFRSAPLNPIICVYDFQGCKQALNARDYDPDDIVGVPGNGAGWIQR